MAEDTLGAAGQATGRAKRELERAHDVRFGAGQSLLVGLGIGVGAIAIKAALNQVIGGDTGFILLMSGTVLAAWFGGLIGGITATVTAAAMNTVIFDPAASALVGGGVVQFRAVLYLVIGAGTASLIGSRRIARDRLEDALNEVASLAEDVESRDAQLEVMLAASKTGFWEWDIPTGELTWSEAIRAQYGMEPADQAPDFATYLDTIHPDDREMFRSALAAAVEGTAPFGLDFRIVWPDGSIHWTHGAGRVFRDDEGRPVRMIGTGQDITERRRTAEERDRLLADERRAGEFREAFIDVISHELRTPVTTILGLTQILARPGRTDDEASRTALLEDVRSESERLARLVEDLLVLSRVERGRLEVELEPLEPRRLLSRVVAQESRELPSINVTTDFERDLPIVAGEATYVEQIVRNLLNNAAKYTPAGSNIVVSARQREGSVEVRVSDDGPGIPQVSIDRIFELFYRDPESARAVAGSGIGLFVCTSLVDAMGGRMWARRRPEGGSEFVFTLRAIEVDLADTEAATHRRPADAIDGRSAGSQHQAAQSDDSPEGDQPTDADTPDE